MKSHYPRPFQAVLAVMKNYLLIGLRNIKRIVLRIVEGTVGSVEAGDGKTEHFAVHVKYEFFDDEYRFMSQVWIGSTENSLIKNTTRNHYTMGLRAGEGGMVWGMVSIAKA